MNTAWYKFTLLVQKLKYSGITGHYHGCWCPGDCVNRASATMVLIKHGEDLNSLHLFCLGLLMPWWLCQQGISNHGIDQVRGRFELPAPILSWETIKKYQHIFMFHEVNLAADGLILNKNHGYHHTPLNVWIESNFVLSNNSQCHMTDLQTRTVTPNTLCLFSVTTSSW